MSDIMKVDALLRFFYNLGKIRCCEICFKVVEGLTKILHFNFAFKTKWVISVDSNVFRVTLLESDCDNLRISFKWALKHIPSKVVDSIGYSNFHVEDSKEKKFSTERKCMSCSIEDFVAVLVIDVVNDYERYKTTKTLQSQISNVSQKCKYLLENANMSDALLVVGNMEFPVHKAMLVAQSPVFYAMFNNDMKEKKENRVIIDDVDPEVMKQLLLYVYTGAVDADSINDDQAVNLLKAADKYDLEELKSICAKIISKNITTDNVFSIISMAEQYKLNYLKKVASYFILCNFEDILKSTDDLDLTKPISYEETSATETKQKI